MLGVVERAMFPRPTPAYTAESFEEGELIWIPRDLGRGSPNAMGEGVAADDDDDDFVPCLLLESKYSRFVCLYFHSNAEDIGNCYHFCRALQLQFEVTVLAVEYPGYGICGGQPSEVSVNANARLVMDFARDVLGFASDSILVLGRSIGCGPALAISAHLPLGGVILVCPFRSLREIVRHTAGSIIAELIGERFPNQELIKQVVAPLLIVHGQKDRVVPCSHGQALYSLCTSRKRLVCPKDMEHNSNILADPSHFIFPAMHFFSLPDFNFDRLQIPAWVRRTRRKPSDKGSTSKEVMLEAAIVLAETVAEHAAAGLDPCRDVEPSASGENDIPEPPEDLGYRKVPPSHRSLSASFHV